MKRLLTLVLFLGSFSLVAPRALAQQDEIIYTDRAAKAAKSPSAKGSIQVETPSLIVLKPAVGAGTKNIPVADISDVIYHLPVARLVYSNARSNEKTAAEAPKEADRKVALGKAVGLYEELLPQVTDEKGKRHIEFKVAKLAARLAEDDPNKVDVAIDKLTKFKKDHAKSWQLAAAIKLLAKLQMDKKDFEGAQKAYAELAAAEGISPELKQEADLLIASAMVKAKKYPDAEKKLQDLAKALPPDDPQRARLQVSLAECQAETGKVAEALKLLEEIIAKGTDPDMVALAYNTRGDCQRKTGKMEEALWDYLWVDVIYHQNRDEHAKATYHLYKLFKEFKKDDAKAKQYREKLEKQFPNSEYQKLLVVEKP